MATCIRGRARSPASLKRGGRCVPVCRHCDASGGAPPPGLIEAVPPASMTMAVDVFASGASAPRPIEGVIGRSVRRMTLTAENVRRASRRRFCKPLPCRFRAVLPLSRATDQPGVCCGRGRNPAPSECSVRTVARAPSTAFRIAPHEPTSNGRERSTRSLRSWAHTGRPCEWTCSSTVASSAPALFGQC